MLLLIAERLLGLAPAPLHRLALRLAHQVRRRWWRIRKPRIQGCRVLGMDAQGRVLLVRHSYGSANWMPPGGGVKQGEDPLIAAAREFEEEIGVVLEAPRLIAATHDAFHGADNVSYIVAGLCSGVPAPDGREIVAAAFFTPGDWPAAMSQGLKKQIEGWLEEEK
ncbi:NUDIX domain-containing protein [Novosphingobium rosa]|uniref:NUDIX domain-containing protein n=1 Tax=Novosphingobium rosa TaxID=76978 RepID=UPI000835F107|nr:NUDIX domain-containing protein [Novosphingobium rosa]